MVRTCITIGTQGRIKLLTSDRNQEEEEEGTRVMLSPWRALAETSHVALSPEVSTNSQLCHLGTFSIQVFEGPTQLQQMRAEMLSFEGH